MRQQAMCHWPHHNLYIKLHLAKLSLIPKKITQLLHVQGERLTITTMAKLEFIHRTLSGGIDV